MRLWQQCASPAPAGAALLRALRSAVPTLLLCCCCAALAGAQRYPVSRNDLAVAIPVDDAHTTVAKAGRSWRKVRVAWMTAGSRDLLQHHGTCEGRGLAHAQVQCL